MGRPGDEHNLHRVITTAQCEQVEACVGCGKPTTMSVVSRTGGHFHVCSMYCVNMIELAKELVRAAEEGREAQVYVPPYGPGKGAVN